MKLPNPFKRTYWIMIWEMALAEFRMRDQGTFLGFLWTLLHPLIYFVVLYNLFVKWMGGRIPDFSLYLIIGIVQWNFFASGTTQSVFAIPRYGAYIKSIRFPKAVLVAASVLSVLFSHVLELLILLVFWLFVKGIAGWAVLGLVPVLLLSIYLVLAVSFVLSTIGVFFLDIGRIWGICMSIGLFLTPIFYSMDMLGPGRQAIILLNPVTHIIQATRTVLIDGTFPALPGLAYVFAFSTVVLALGFWMFRRNEAYFIERI